MKAVQERIHWDKLGAYASAICAVHCLLTGLALGLLSVAGLKFLASTGAEAAFVLMAFTLGVIAVWHGVRRHRSWIPAAIFIGGLLFILVSHFGFGHTHDGRHHPMSTLLSVLGGLALVGFHVTNHRLKARDDEPLNRQA
jgi:hypothetical protein